MKNGYTYTIVTAVGLWLLKEIYVNFYNINCFITILLLTCYILLVIAQIIAYRIGISKRKRGKLPPELNDSIIETSKNSDIKPPAVYFVDKNEPSIYSSNLIASPIIIIYAGLIELLAKDELEAVLYHEAYHIKRRKSFIIGLIVLLLFITSGGTYWHIIALYIMVAAFNRRSELNADLFAVKMSTKEVYLEALRKVSERKHEKEGFIYEILSSHPSYTKRISFINQS